MIGPEIRKIIVIIAGVVAIYGVQCRQVDSNRAGCDRGTVTSRAIADVGDEQRTYLDGVLGAHSVKQDVKTAAKPLRQKWAATARAFHNRAAVDCHDAYPYPFPLNVLGA